jgi:hypothetical protein
MNLPEMSTIIQVLLVLAALAVLWTILRAVLKLTARLFMVGCLAIVGIVALVWAVGVFG